MAAGAVLVNGLDFFASVSQGILQAVVSAPAIVGHISNLSVQQIVDCLYLLDLFAYVEAFARSHARSQSVDPSDALLGRREGWRPLPQSDGLEHHGLSLDDSLAAFRRSFVVVNRVIVLASDDIIHVLSKPNVRMAVHHFSDVLGAPPCGWRCFHRRIVYHRSRNQIIE